MITNRTLVQGAFLEQMEKVVCLHPHAVILREKDLPDEEYEASGRKSAWYSVQERMYRVFCTPEFRLPGSLAVADIHLSIPYAAVNVQRAGADRTSRGILQEISISCHSLEDMQLAVTGWCYSDHPWHDL